MTDPERVVEILEGNPDRDFLAWLVSCRDGEVWRAVAKRALDRTLEVFSGRIIVRGLVEFSSFCRNNCLYCGLRRDVRSERYRLSPEEILEACHGAHEAGIRSFVLQSGEDPYYDGDRMTGIISSLKSEFPDSAVTLSIGEKPFEEYAAYRRAGADRFLLRHETADPVHYSRLHPPEMSLKNRIRCLFDLKRLGFQTGAGFMVGSPFQTPLCIADDLLFLRGLRPHMIGIGPFIPQKDTPFSGFPPGDAGLSIRLLSVLRVMHPFAMIPSTTALEALGRREDGFRAGGNVIMVNVSPGRTAGKYSIYDGKPRCSGAVEAVAGAVEKITGAGFAPDFSAGHSPLTDLTEKGGKA